MQKIGIFACLILLTGCSKVSELGFPAGVSSVTDQSLPLWQGAWIAAGVVGVITLVLILWPAVFHHHMIVFYYLSNYRVDNCNMSHQD